MVRRFIEEQQLRCVEQQPRERDTPALATGQRPDHGVQTVGEAAQLQSKLWATLRAVAVDSEARELISAGRLVRDYEISDLGLGFAQAQTPRASPAEAPPPPRSDAAADAALARKIRGVRQRLERSRARALEIEQKLEDARRDVEDARREAARAASVLDRAQATAEQARVSAQDTTGRVTELEATLLELESRSRA